MTDHRQPNRGKDRISQAYNSGYVTILQERDTAEPGLQPKVALQPKLTVPYEERQLGYRRYYEAKQNQIQIQRVLRIQRAPVEVNSQDTAMTEDGKLYRIDLVQSVQDSFPPSLDLTLVAYEQKEASE